MMSPMDSMARMRMRIAEVCTVHNILIVVLVHNHALLVGCTFDLSACIYTLVLHRVGVPGSTHCLEVSRRGL